MTSPSTPTIRFPRPFPHQQALIDAPHRRKIPRWGRRASKSRMAFIASSVGHGPLIEGPGGREPMHRGFIRGGLVAWIGIGYDQTQKIWEEEVKPRFAGVPGFTVHEGDYRVEAPPYGPDRVRGNLTLYTSRNVGSLLGSKLHGIVLDEFAHWEGDPFDAWRRVLRFTLLDFRGWAIFPSTPNPGSYFDQLCNEHPYGADDLPQPERPDSVWIQTHHDTSINPRLSPEDVAEVIAEYEPGDPKLDTEVYARLITGGAGLAFPQFVSNPQQMVHTVHPSPLPRYYRPMAGLDWGWRTGVVCTYEAGPEGEIVQVHEKPLAEHHAAAAGKAYIEELLELGMRLPELLAYDQQMDYDAGQKVGASLAQEFLEGMVDALNGNHELAPRMMPARKGPGTRIAGWNMVRKALAWKDSRDERGRLNPWAAPRYRVFTSCAGTIAEFSKACNSAKVHGDVDGDASPTHRLDCIRYLLAVKAEGGELPARDTPPDVSPGLRRDGQLRQRREPAPWERGEQDQGFDQMPGDLYNPWGPNIEMGDE